MNEDEIRGQLITRLREDRLWTREELAKRAGVTPTTVTQAETGRTHVRLKTIGKLAEALGVPAARLLRPAGEKEPALSGKAEAPEAGPATEQESLPVSSAEPPPEEVSEEERHYLRALFGSWGHHIDDQNDKWGPLLRDLPEDPTAEEYESGCKVIEEAFATYESILNAMARYGVLETLDRFVDDLEDDEPVPDEIRQEVIYLKTVFNPMHEYIFPRGKNWTTRADESYRMQTSLDATAEKWAQRLGTQRT